MQNGTMLYATQINHGQSEIWLGTDSEELIPRRIVATNEVVNVTRRLCDPEVFKDFYVQYYASQQKIVSLSDANITEIAKELKLAIS